MVKIISILTGCILLSLSDVKAQTSAKSMKEPATSSDNETEIVLIETEEIPAVVNKTLSKDYKRPRNQTVYMDHYTRSYIRYDQIKKKTYISKKNSGIVLELHRSKRGKEKTSAVANQ